MPLPFALLASLLLHGLLFLPLIPPPAPRAAERLEVHLSPPPAAEPPPVDIAQASTEPPPEAAVETPLAPVAPLAPAHQAKAAPPAPAQAQTRLVAPTQLRFYPEEAVRQGIEGDVLLQLALDEKGRVYSVEIVTSSGSPLLDRAAVTAAKNIGAMPGNPSRTRLPVSFRLTP